MNKLISKTLFKKNITGCWPLWAIASFILALTSFSTFSIFYDERLIYGADNFCNNIQTLVMLNPIFVFIYAIFVGYFTWSFMFKAKKVNFVHSLPINRITIYTTSVLSGLTIMLIPYLAAIIVITVIASLSGTIVIGLFLEAILIIICEAIIMFAVATFCAHVTGSNVAMPILYFIFNFLVAIVDSCIRTIAYGFLFGVKELSSDVATLLSPPVGLLEYVGVQLEGNPLEGAYIAYIYGGVGILILVLTYILYKRRKSESAGFVVSEQILRPVFKYGVAIFAGLDIGFAIYSIVFFNDLFIYGDVYYFYVPMVICVAIAGVAGYYGATMLLEKKFKVFTGRSLIGAAAVIAVLSLVISVFNFDIFGISTRVPSKEDIESVTVNYNDKEYEFYSDTDLDKIEKIVEIHSDIVGNIDEFRMIETMGVTGDVGETILYDTAYDEVYAPDGDGVSEPVSIDMEKTEEENFYYRFTLEYKLADGSTLSRSYSFDTRSIVGKHTWDMLDEFEKMKDMSLYALKLQEGSRYSVDSISIYGTTIEYQIIGSKNNSVIIDAIKQDIAAGVEVVGYYNIYPQEYIELTLDMSDGEKRCSNTIIVNEDMTNTINAINMLRLSDAIKIQINDK